MPFPRITDLELPVNELHDKAIKAERIRQENLLKELHDQKLKSMAQTRPIKIPKGV